MKATSNDSAPRTSPMRTLPFLPACLLAWLACGEVEEEIPLDTGGPTLGGTSWLVQEYPDAAGAMTTTDSGVELHATFTVDGRVAGFAGCNDYTGNFATDGPHITIHPELVTDAVCGAERMARETAILGALRKAATWEIRGKQLTIRKRDGAPVLVCSSRRPLELPQGAGPAAVGTSR